MLIELTWYFGRRVLAMGRLALSYAENQSKLRNEFSANVACHVGEAIISALEAIGQPRVVDSHLVENGRVQVVDMNGVGNRVVPELVRFANERLWSLGNRPLPPSR